MFQKHSTPFSREKGALLFQALFSLGRSLLLCSTGVWAFQSRARALAGALVFLASMLPESLALCLRRGRRVGRRIRIGGLCVALLSLAAALAGFARLRPWHLGAILALTGLLSGFCLAPGAPSRPGGMHAPVVAGAAFGWTFGPLLALLCSFLGGLRLTIAANLAVFALTACVVALSPEICATPGAAPAAAAKGSLGDGWKSLHENAPLRWTLILLWCLDFLMFAAWSGGLMALTLLRSSEAAFYWLSAAIGFGAGVGLLIAPPHSPAGGFPAILRCGAIALLCGCVLMGTAQSATVRALLGMLCAGALARSGVRAAALMSQEAAGKSASKSQKADAPASLAAKSPQTHAGNARNAGEKVSPIPASRQSRDAGVGVRALWEAGRLVLLIPGCLAGSLLADALLEPLTHAPEVPSLVAALTGRGTGAGMALLLLLTGITGLLVCLILAHFWRKRRP